MADTPKTKTADTPAATKEAVSAPSTLETTTAHDGSIAINQPPGSPAPETPATPETVPTVPETPITVSEADVSAGQVGNEKLAEEVEALSGEIQALEAKIDRLTGNINPVEDKVTSTPTTPETKAPVEPPKPKEPDPTTMVNRPSESLSVPVAPAAKSTQPVTDIYSKSTTVERKPEEKTANNPDEAQEVGGGSGIGVVGEVLTVFGLIIFLALAASPFYKSIFAASLLEAIRSIGWPTAAASLGLGFLLSIFNKGKLLMKIFTFLIFILATIIYMGLAGYESYLGPLAPMLSSVLSFYR